jgi:hypothetical protein
MSKSKKHRNRESRRGDRIGGGKFAWSGVCDESEPIRTGVTVSTDGKCPHAVGKPNVYVSMEVVNQVIALTRGVDTEFLVLLYGNDLGDDLQVNSIIVPPQSVSEALCEIDNDYVVPDKNGTDIFLGMGHSHNRMAVFSSSTDNQSIGNYRLSAIFNQKLEYKLFVKKRLECGAQIVVEASLRGLVDDAVITAMKANIKPKYAAKGTTYVYGKGHGCVDVRFARKRDEWEEYWKRIGVIPPNSPPVNALSRANCDDETLETIGSMKQYQTLDD